MPTWLGSARCSSSSRWKGWGGLRLTWTLSVVEAQHIHPLDGVVFRITDRQGYQATERWTLNLAEQARLEALINRVKPPLPVDWPEAETGQPLPVHSLLLTPFRYPPHPLRTGRDSVHPIPGNSSMPLGRWRKCWPRKRFTPCGCWKAHLCLLWPKPGCEPCS